jgi:hypothetical protein
METAKSVATCFKGSLRLRRQLLKAVAKLARTSQWQGAAGVTDEN